jgi:ferrous iron transport protein A
LRLCLNSTFGSRIRRIVRVPSLEQVAVGQTVSVVDVPGDDLVSLRLLEMGLTPGVRVSVVAVAPLGDPLELNVRGYRLSIRRREAALVAVAP